MIKRFLSLGVALVFVLALVAPALMAVPASAVEYVSPDNLTLCFRGDGSTYQVNKYAFNSSDVTLHGRFYITNGTADNGSVHIPVGNNVNEVYVSSVLYIDASNLYINVTNYEPQPALQLQVTCYDANKTSLGVVYSGVLFDNHYTGHATVTASISGVQFPAGTEFITIYTRFCGKNPSTLLTNGNAYDLSGGTYSASFGYTVHTSEFDWTSAGFDTIPTASVCPFAFSHDGQQVYLSKGDNPVLSILAEGFAGVDMYARFNSLNGTTKTVQLFHDSLSQIYYNSFSYNFPDTDDYNSLWVDFLIDGKVIYTTQDCTLYYPGWSGSGPGSSTDDAISDSISEVQEDVQAVMDAVGETNDKLDNLQGSVDDIVSGESGVDSSVTDFNSVSDSLSSSLSDANAVIDSGVDSLNGLVSSQQMLGTAAALGSVLSAAFVGNEISLCGITGNPFELAVIFFGSMGVIALVITYVFRKRGGG